MESQIFTKYKLLQQYFADKPKVAVAFSGGVDSSLVLQAATESIGRENVLALHARLAFQQADEGVEVKKVTDHIGCRLQILSINPLEWPEFVENPANRCYICKKKIFGAFRDHLVDERIEHLLDGTNADDLLQPRPGLKALAELGVDAPLAEAGLVKAEIRTLSRSLAIPTWNKPSASCLATRIDCGQKITTEKLALVAVIEQFLSDRGYNGSRARLSSGRLLLELQLLDNVKFFNSDARRELLNRIATMGIGKVYLDILGRE